MLTTFFFSISRTKFTR